MPVLALLLRKMQRVYVAVLCVRRASEEEPKRDETRRFSVAKMACSYNIHVGIHYGPQLRVDRAAIARAFSTLEDEVRGGECDLGCRDHASSVPSTVDRPVALEDQSSERQCGGVLGGGLQNRQFGRCHEGDAPGAACVKGDVGPSGQVEGVVEVVRLGGCGRERDTARARLVTPASEDRVEVAVVECSKKKGAIVGGSCIGSPVQRTRRHCFVT